MKLIWNLILTVHLAIEIWNKSNSLKIYSKNFLSFALLASSAPRKCGCCWPKHGSVLGLGHNSGMFDDHRMRLVSFSGKVLFCWSQGRSLGVCHRIELFIRSGLLDWDRSDIRRSFPNRCQVPVPDDLLAFLYLYFGFLSYPGHLPVSRTLASGFYHSIAWKAELRSLAYLTGETISWIVSI